MLKKIALTVSLALAIVSASDAATIVFSAGESNSLNADNGTDLAVGSLVRVGVFSLTDAQIQSAFAAQNLAALDQGFTEIGVARVGDGFGFSGHFTKAVDFDTAAIAGQQMALWVYQSADNSTVSASKGTALQIGIFYMDRALNGAWAVPPQQPVPGSSVIDIADLTDPATLNTTLRSGAHVVVGNFPRGTSDATSAPGFGTAVVPEPSTLALLGIASLGILARRRSK